MNILFSPFSPFVRKCLATGMELGLNERITLLACSAHPINRDHEIVAFNPLGKIPTFFTDDGLVLYDSRVICEYLNDLVRGSLIPSAGRARWETLTLQSLGDGISDAAVLVRYEDAVRPQAFRWNDWKVAQMEKVETSLAALDTSPQLMTDRVDIGSIAVGCALWYLDLRFANWGWRERHPQLAVWYAAFSQRPAMAASWSQG
jgi:glutathione S-transferase